jgi:hypothetical protein
MAQLVYDVARQYAFLVNAIEQGNEGNESTIRRLDIGYHLPSRSSSSMSVFDLDEGFTAYVKQSELPAMAIVSMLLAVLICIAVRTEQTTLVGPICRCCLRD